MNREDKAQDVINRSIIAGSEKNFREFVVETLCDIKKNGCAKACSEPKAHVRPHIVSTALATAIVGIAEACRRLSQ